MLQGRARHGTPVSDCFESGHLCRGPRTGMVSPCCLQNLLQGQHLHFGDEHAGLPVRACAVTVAARAVDHGHDFDIEFKAEFSDTSRGPMPEGRFANSPDDLLGLTHVVITFTVDNVGGRTARGSGNRFHRGRMSSLLRKVTQKILKFFKALSTLLLALEAEDTLTGSPAAFRSQMEGSEATSEDWRSDATGFYE